MGTDLETEGYGSEILDVLGVPKELTTEELSETWQDFVIALGIDVAMIHLH